MWAAYHNYRTLTTLEAVVRLTLQIRRCLNARCPQFRKPYRPEALVGFRVCPTFYTSGNSAS